MLGTTLDVAIGLIFIFMLFSLFLSTFLEAWAGLLMLRARALKIAIAQLIEDPDAIPVGARLPAMGGFGLIGWLYGWGGGAGASGAAAATSAETEGATASGAAAAAPVETEGATASGAAAAAPVETEGATASGAAATPAETEGAAARLEPLRFAEIYGHPLVAAIPRPRPSYVPAANFTSALLHVLGDGGEGTLQSDIERRIATLPDGQLRKALTTALNEAQGDMAKLRLGIERWYDNAMDRLSGRYKRFSQAAMFLLALALAVTFRIDTIQIGERLYADAALRGAFVQAATNYVETHPSGPGGTAAPPNPPAPSGAAPNSSGGGAIATPPPGGGDAQAAADFNLRVERLRQARTAMTDAMALFGTTPTARPMPNGPGGADIGAWFGFILTALAGMLGAPFWFDLLQKLVRLRGSGPPPADPARTNP